jgi:ABC-type Fe3+/spermidine/putrescine transport system ATPase subunit
MLPGVVVRSDTSGTAVKLAGGKVFMSTSRAEVAAGDNVLLAVRAERIQFRPSTEGDNVLSARVKSWVYVGSAYEYLLETPAGEVRAESPEEVSQEQVGLYLPPDGIVVLREEHA